MILFGNPILLVGVKRVAGMTGGGRRNSIRVQTVAREAIRRPPLIHPDTMGTGPRPPLRVREQGGDLAPGRDAGGERKRLLLMRLLLGAAKNEK